MARASMARVLERASTKKRVRARVTSTARVTRKARAKERKAKAKDMARRRDLHPTRVSQVIAGRVASGDTERTSAGNVMFREWRKLRVLPRVRQCGAQWSLTSAAAKTAAVIQEVDEDESGWIFGVVGRSGTAATTDRDEVWDELVLDIGSVSTACPYAWCADIRVNDKEKAYLQDIQQRRIPSHGSRVVPLELWGPEGNVQCMVKFDVADVAYPVVSL